MPRVVLMCGQKVREVFDVSEGVTLHGVMLARNPETENWPRPTICIFGAQPVLRKEWASTALRGDDVAVFAELPMGGGGGGSNPLQTIFTVAIIAASLAAPYLAATSLGWGTITAAGAITWKGAMLSAGIMMAGSIVSSMAFSQPTGQIGAAQAEQASPTYSLNGSGNRARLYQPELESFGKMLIVPDVIADQWTQYISNEMYLYQVFGTGRGSYQRHELSFGDVVFWRDGRIIESAYSTESGEQYTNDIKQGIVAVDMGGDWVGPYRAVGIGENARTINVTLNFSEGLTSYDLVGHKENPDGGYDPVWKNIEATVTVEAQYREINSTGVAISEWSNLFTKTVTESKDDAFTVLVHGKAKVYGQYEIRLRNISETLPTVTGEIVEHGEVHDITYTYSIEPKQGVYIDNVSSVSVPVYVQFVESGDVVTLFPDNIEASTNVASQELIAPNAENFAVIGPFFTNSPGTTIDQILLSYIAPSGIGQYNNSGNLVDYSVSIQAEYRRVDDNGAPISGWSVLRDTTLTAGTLTAQRRTETCAVSPGRYQVQVRRTSDKREDNKAVDTVQWESMVSIIPGSLTYRQSAIAIKLKATNTLSQNAASNFKVLQTRKLPLYDRKTRRWSEAQPTRAFAAAMSHVVKAKWGGNLVDRQIDLDGLWRIGEELEAKGWHFDACIDGAYLVWQLVTEMCEAYRVVPRAAGSVLSFIMDKATRPVKHVFTPYDIVRGSFSPTWNTFSDDTPDDVLVSYLDDEVGYVQRDVRAKLSESESRKTATQTYLGVCNRDHAHKIGLFKAACNRWRRLGCEFETEGVGRNLTLGDVISITHPRFRDTLAGTLETWDESALVLKLNRAISIDDDAVPYMSLTRPNGTPWGPVKLLWVDDDMVRFDPTDYAALIMQGMESPFAWLTVGNDRIPTVWTLQAGREFTRRYIITGITPQSLYRYKISCINDDERVDSYDDMPTPPWEYRSNLPTFDELLEPENLQVTVTTSSTGKTVVASWSEVRGATAYEIQHGADGINWTRYGQVNISSVTLQLGAGAVWLRVATVRGLEQSGWTIWH